MELVNMNGFCGIIVILDCKFCNSSVLMLILFRRIVFVVGLMIWNRVMNMEDLLLLV